MSLTDEFLAAARAAVQAIIVFDVDRPNNDGSAQTPARYAVLTADPGSLAAMALCGRFDTAEIQLELLSVGTTRSEVESISTRIRDALLGHEFLSPPWRAEVVEHFSQPPRRDPDIPGRVVIFGTDQYTVQATRA